MKLGINTYTYMWSIGFEGARPEKPLTACGLLEKAHALGVQVVQSGPNLPLDELPAAELERFERAAQQGGFEIEVGTRGLETEHLLRQVALCRRMNSRLLRTLPEVGGATPPLAELPGYLRAILPHLEAADVRLGLENGQIPAQALAECLDQVGSPMVGAVLDMVNSLAIPEGWQEVTRWLAPYTMCLHYKDFSLRRAWHRMGFICEGRPAGQGQLDAAWLFAALKASPHDFNVIVELWTPEQQSLAATIALEQKWAEASVAYLRKWM